MALAAVCAWWWRRRKTASPIEQAGIALIVAGAVGNLADRLIRGFVVDFIYLHYWPIFNVADALVAIGALMLLLGTRHTPALK